MPRFTCSQKRADKAQVAFEQKAAAWAKLAAYSSENAYKELAEKRRDVDRNLSWKEIADVLSVGGAPRVDEAALRKRFERLKEALRARLRGECE